MSVTAHAPSRHAPECARVRSQSSTTSLTAGDSIAAGFRGYSTITERTRGCMRYYDNQGSETASPKIVRDGGPSRHRQRTLHSQKPSCRTPRKTFSLPNTKKHTAEYNSYPRVHGQSEKESVLAAASLRGLSLPARGGETSGVPRVGWGSHLPPDLASIKTIANRCHSRTRHSQL